MFLTAIRDSSENVFVFAIKQNKKDLGRIVI